MASTAPIDITLRLEAGMLLYPGDVPPHVRYRSTIAGGEALTDSEIRLGCHVGTHVDAPAHFIGDGRCVDELPLKHFYGEAQVVEFPDLDRVTPDDMAGKRIDRECHILIKTRNSQLLRNPTFDPGYCYLTPESVRELLAHQPLSIGFDYYSLDPPSADSFPSHVAVARHGIPVFVCLDLNDALPGKYTFVALPLRLPGVEGLPVRAVLFPQVQT